MAYGDPEAFSDAGASLRVSITLPDGSQREIQMPNATNELRTENTPEFPNGSRVDITPQFLKGSDNNPDEDEALEVEVNVTSAPGYDEAAQYYDVQIQQGGSEVEKKPLKTGANAKAKPAQKAAAKMGTPAKAVQISSDTTGRDNDAIGGKSVMQIQDVDSKPTGTGAKVEENLTGAVIYVEYFGILPGGGTGWITFKTLNFMDAAKWQMVTKDEVDGAGKFTNQPIGPSNGLISNRIAEMRPTSGLTAPVRVRYNVTQQYRINWQGNTYTLPQIFHREILGTVNNAGQEYIYEFTTN